MKQFELVVVQDFHTVKDDSTFEKNNGIMDRKRPSNVMGGPAVYVTRSNNAFIL
jgi:hypothetical protein